MKKLKKVLSLVLVLAMALSVFGVCASATNIEDYTDADEITYTEAVGVLSGLGVLTGDENGFRPTDTLNRAEAAKIASYLIGLQDEVVEGPTFTDVKNVEAEEIKWAAGYIAICESQGLVHGNGDGTYAPLGTLTGYEWEKIVLGALGYDAEIEGMLGDSWQGGVANLAKKVGLLDGLNSDYKAGNAITREQAAQIAFNALFAKTVVYPTTINKIAVFGDKTLGELIFGLKVETTFDIYGAPTATVYTNGNAKAGTKAVTYATFPITAVEEYNNVAAKVSLKEINDDLTDAKLQKVATYYVDGVDTTLPTNTSTKIGGRGVDVAVYSYYDNNAGASDVRVVVKNTYVAEIVEKKNSDFAYIAKGATNTNGKADPDTVENLVTVAGAKNAAYLEAGDLKAGDIITYNVGDQKNANAKLPSKAVVGNAEVKTPYAGTATTVSFNGKQDEARTKGYIAFDKGENIYFDVNAVYSEIPGKAITNGTLDIKNYYGYVYDNYGNIIYIYETTPATVSEVGHLYVIGTISYYTDGKTENLDSLWEPILDPKAAAQALVIEYTDTTAEVKVVDLAIAETVDNKFAYVDKYGNVSTDIVSVGGLDQDKYEKFVEYYKTSDGEYILAKCANEGTVSTDRASEKITYDNANVEGDYVLASSSTKLTYLTATIDPYTVKTLNRNNIAAVAKSIEVTAETVTGYQNFKSFTGTDGYLYTGADSKATVGATIGKTNVQDSITYAMFVSGVEKTTGTQKEYVYSFLGSDGKTVNYVAENAEDQDEVAADIVAAGGTKVSGGASMISFVPGEVYKLALNSKGNIVAYKVIDVAKTGLDTDTIEYGTATATDAGYLKVSTGATTGSYYVSSYFQGYVYDAIAEKAKAITAVEELKDYVAIYTDEIETAPTKTEEQIVFVKVVKEYTEETYEVKATLTERTNDDIFTALAASTSAAQKEALDNVVVKDGGSYTFNEKDPNLMRVSALTGKLLAADKTEITDRTLYYGKEFTVTIKVTTYANGNKKYTAIDAVADNTYASYTGKVVYLEKNEDGLTYTLKLDASEKNADGKTYDFPVKHDVPYTKTTGSVVNFAENGLKVNYNYATVVTEDGNVISVAGFTSDPAASTAD